MGILRSNVELKVPLSQIHYDENEFMFKWKKAWLPVPYDEKVLKKKDARILEEFKDNLEDDVTIRFYWHRIRNLPEDMLIWADTSVMERINKVIACARTLLSNMEERMASGKLSMKEAKDVMAKSELKSDDEIIRRILTDIVRRMPNQQIKMKLQVPLSQLIYDSNGLQFKWNEIWLAVPYEQQPLEIKNRRLLEIFKSILKSEVTIYISWDRIFQKIDAIHVEASLANEEEIEELSSRVERCAENIRTLVKKRALSLDEAKDVLAAEGLACSDDEVHRILTDITDEMGLQKEAVRIEVPLKDIEYGPSEFTFHYVGKSFRLDNAGLPFKTGPILEEIKGQLEGNLIFHMDRYCLVKWDYKSTKLLVGELRIGDEDVGKKVDIEPNILESFEELRVKMICDAINALNRRKISIEQVESILQAWGLGLEDRKIGDKIIATIPPWPVERIFRVPAKDVQYSSYGIKFSPNGELVFISSSSLPFGTSDVLDKIKDIFVGDIKVTEIRSVRFMWSSMNNRLRLVLGQVSTLYKVEAEDELLERFRRVYVMYKALKTKFPDLPDKDIVDILRRSGYVRELPPGSVDPGYNPQCITILDGKAEHIYMTGIDLWFKIGDVLVWERPEYRAATYVFKWPEQERSLEDFIAKIWSYELLEDITIDPETGYKYRVIHDYDNELYNWKKKFGNL